MNCNICGEEYDAKIHTDTELHPDDAADDLFLHEFNGGIPQDFLDIDDDKTHWRWVEFEHKPYVVPATETGDGKRLTDMTAAMMGEVAHQDDTVEPIKLTDKLQYKFMMAFLMQDGNLGVPGGRYGRDTEDCARIAILQALIMQYHHGEPITYYQLNSDMGMVVNGADGVATMLSESQYILNEVGAKDISVKDLLDEEYEPQTESEKLVAWINDNLAWVDAELDENGQLTIICQDEDGVHNLLRSMSVEFPDND